MKQFTIDINNTKIKITRIYNAIFSRIIPFVSWGYKCKRIVKYFQYYILYISLRTNIFSPIIFFAARITVRAICPDFVGAPLPRSPVFCHLAQGLLLNGNHQHFNEATLQWSTKQKVILPSRKKVEKKKKLFSTLFRIINDPVLRLCFYKNNKNPENLMQGH